MSKKQLANIKDYLLPYEKRVLYDGETLGLILNGTEGELSDSVANYDQIIVQGFMFYGDKFYVTDFCTTDIMFGQADSLSVFHDSIKFKGYQGILIAPSLGDECRIEYHFSTDTKISLDYVINTSGWTVGIRKVIGIRRSAVCSTPYLFDERVIGKWSNGKDIYRVTIPEINTPDAKTLVDLSSYNIDEIINLSGIFSTTYTSTGIKYNYPMVYAYVSDNVVSWYYGRTSNTLVVNTKTDGVQDSKINITIDFTKK